MADRRFLLCTTLSAGAALLLLLARQTFAQGGLDCAAVDLVFVMDTSGSMRDEAEALCTEIAAVLEGLAGYGIEVRPAFLGILEDGGSVPEFACLTDQVGRLLGTPVPGDSACGTHLGNLEDWAAAAAIVAARFDWTAGAVRVIVPLSDEAPCQGGTVCGPADQSAIDNAITVANENGVAISPIMAGGSSSCAVELATELAAGTRGVMFRSRDPDRDLPRAIRRIVISTCSECRPRCVPVDLVFVMDTSGSMDDEATVLCAEIEQVAVSLGLLGVDVAPVFLGITDRPFSCLTDTVVDLLGGAVPGMTTCGSSVFHPEDWGSGVAILAERFSWNDGSARVVVPLSDEGPCQGDPCEDPGDDGDAIENAIAVATENEVVISPITGTGSTSCVVSLARRAAEATGGVSFASTDPNADLAAALFDIGIATCAADDCNTNGVRDACELAADLSADCNGNGLPDDCDLNEDNDLNANGVLDACEECTGHAVCDDGVFCNGVERCVQGRCQSVGDPCAPLGLVCDEVRRACSCNGTRDCDDELFCNGQERCVLGACAAGPVPCPDRGCDEANDQCLDCSSDRGCDDGLYCTGVERCVNGACRSSGDPCLGGPLPCLEPLRRCGCAGDSDCDDGDSCTEDVCSLAVGLCRSDPIDWDDDGLPDCADECLATPAEAEVDVQGCSCHQRDTDEDGVDDCADGCPETPRFASVDVDGCACSQLDADTDGVADCDDRCVATPTDEASDPRGCSCSQKDDDEDGVVNCLDWCLYTPSDEAADEQGCSASQLATVEAEAAALLAGEQRGGGAAPGCGACGAVGWGSGLLLGCGLPVLRRASRRGVARAQRC